MAAASAPASRGTSKTETVTFKVEGKTFEVLREPTLSLHPDCVLAQMAEESDGAEPILLEASGELFPHLLEYLRHHKVTLPMGVSRVHFMDAASKLSIDADPERVSQESLPLGSLLAMAQASTVEEGKQLQAQVTRQKLQLLVSLVKQAFIAKVSKAPLTEAVTLETAELTSGTGPPGIAGGIVAFLSRGITSSTILDALQPWASAHGYNVALYRRLAGTCYMPCVEPYDGFDMEDLGQVTFERTWRREVRRRVRPAAAQGAY